MTDELVELKPQVYADPRPAEYFLPYHERARTHEPDWVYDAVRSVITPLNLVALRAWSIGADRVPASGPVIIAPNHFSNMDHFLLAMFLRRKVRFVSKSQLFVGPLKWIFFHGGVIPVQRGKRDEELFVTTEIVLQRGGCLAMYAEGGRSRSGRLSDRVRPGLGRLALDSGAPVVPAAIHGSARVRNWRRLDLPKVTVQFGAPLRFPRVERSTRDQQQQAAEAIFAEVRALYEGLDRHGRRGAARLAREARRARTGVGAGR